jgi:tRNA A-37 threonylcarbamoyl transferase component Bud32
MNRKLIKQRSSLSESRYQDKKGAYAVEEKRKPFFRSIKPSRNVGVTPSVKSFSEAIKFAQDHLNHIPRLKKNDENELISRFGKSFALQFVERYRPSRIIGEGRYGIVVAICKDRYECLAVKIQQVHSEYNLEREIRIQQKLSNLELCPKIVTSPTFFKHDNKNFAVISMEIVDKDLMTLLEGNLELKSIEMIAGNITDMIALIANSGCTHGDFHIANLSMKFRKNAWEDTVIYPQLLDFGQSTDKFSDPRLDTLQMLRTLLEKQSPTLNTDNRKFLLKHLFEFYNDFFLPKLNNLSEIEDLHKKYNNEYLKHIAEGSEKQPMSKNKTSSFTPPVKMKKYRRKIRSTLA